MSLASHEYYNSTQHPIACALFVVPLLAAYELGLAFLEIDNPHTLRNGADTWLIWTFSRIGLRVSYLPGTLVGIGLVGWAWANCKNIPKELPGVWMGMLLESVLLALGLWGLSRALGPLVDYAGLPLAAGTKCDPAIAQIVSFVGAGVYEEVVFRLLLLTMILKVFQLGDVGQQPSQMLAIVVSALLFSAAHHVGAAGEEFQGYVFLFRFLAGIYFAVIFQRRGFGVAVGAHTGYDLLVGVILATPVSGM
ncbi:MAG: lysostaphin resistance A-like protein [Gemmataceae bacterium]